jgi:hypothetical protein
VILRLADMAPIYQHWYHNTIWHYACFERNRDELLICGHFVLYMRSELKWRVQRKDTDHLPRSGQDTQAK